MAINSLVLLHYLKYNWKLNVGTLQLYKVSTPLCKPSGSVMVYYICPQPRNSPEVKENVPPGEVVTREVRATDPDTTADLVFEIDWKDSYATKQGRAAPTSEFHKYAILVPLTTYLSFISVCEFLGFRTL